MWVQQDREGWRLWPPNSQGGMPASLRWVGGVDMKLPSPLIQAGLGLPPGCLVRLDKKPSFSHPLMVWNRIFLQTHLQTSLVFQRRELGHLEVKTSLDKWYQSEESKYFIFLSWQVFVSQLLFFAFLLVSSRITFLLRLIGFGVVLLPVLPNLQTFSYIFNSNPSAFPPVYPTKYSYIKINNCSVLNMFQGRIRHCTGKQQMSQSAQGKIQPLFNLCLITSTVSWLWETWTQAESVSLRVSNGQSSRLARKHGPKAVQYMASKKKGTYL